MVASSLRRAGAEKQTVYLARAIREAGAALKFFHLGEGGHYEKVLHRMGMTLSRIYRQKRPFLMLAGLTKAFCDFGPEIVFAPQFGDLLHGGIAGRMCNALVLGGLRSDGFYELNTSGRRSRWMLRLAHGLVANSHRAVQNLRSKVAKLPRMTVLPNVLDLREFDDRSERPPPFRIPSSRVAAVAVGSLQSSKRFDRFLQALALARRRVPALLGLIAGADCGSRQALEQQAPQLGLEPDHVLFLGDCDNVPALLVRAGFLVLCSEYEGFPNVILEAMAARLPVITTPVGDAERIVLQGQTGFVVDGADVPAMADRMVELALSPTARARLGAEGRKRVVSEYNYESLGGRLLAVFREFAVHNRKLELTRRFHSWCTSPETARLAEILVPIQPTG